MNSYQVVNLYGYGFCTCMHMIRQNIGNRANLLATYAFRRVFDRVDKAAVKKGVDEMGLDAFIKRCARLAATTGIVSGIGGIATMVVGVPADVLNNLTQQFRVTLAVIYAKTGDYEVSFEDLMAIVAISVGAEAGVMITRSALVRIAERLMIRMSERTAARVVPLLGAAIGGATNYFFIKGIGASLKRVIVARSAPTGS
jgi:hypothetical protein